MTATPPTVLEPATAPLPARRGGLAAAPKNEMTPTLALLVLFLIIDVLFIVAPFHIFRFTDDPWGAPERLAGLARAMAWGLAFGLVAGIAAERRNHSAWMFVCGHLAFFVAIVCAFMDWDLKFPRGSAIASVLGGFGGACVAMILTSRPRAALREKGPLLQAVCRFTYLVGNIWLGIGLLGSIAVLLWYGINVEDELGTKAAQYLVYRSWWFGAIFFTGGISMLAATFRKYPFRLEQVGWLTVHAGLSMVVIGAMTSFVSSTEGDVEIREGQTKDTFTMTTQTRVEVTEQIRREDGKTIRNQVFSGIARFDVDPTEQKPKQQFEISPAGATPFTLVVDRYYANSAERETWTDDFDHASLGIELGLTMRGGGPPQTIRLSEENPTSQLPFGGRGMPITMAAVPPKMIDGLITTEVQTGHGRIVVLDDEDKEVLNLPVEPGAGERSDGAAAPLTAKGTIAGTGIEVRLKGYYDGMRVEQGRTTLIDASPGEPGNPAVELTFAGPEGDETRQILAFYPSPRPADRDPATPDRRKYHYYARYDFVPQIPLEGPLLLFVSAGERFHWIYVNSTSERVSGLVTPGKPLGLPMPAFTITPTAVYNHLRIEHTRDFVSTRVERQAVRMRVESTEGKPAPAEPLWLGLGDSTAFTLNDRQYMVSWRPTVRRLGFSLHLNAFHRDFYPGSTEEMSYESYCELRHPEKYPDGTDIKIDMNHPLRLDGWRLYQARFGGDGKTTILQVNRDPGLGIIYPACAVVLLGLVVVFFMKPTLGLLRRSLEKDGARPATHFVHALRALLAVGFGPLVFGTYVAVRGLKPDWGLPLSGWPSFAFGVGTLILVPIAVVYYYIGPVRRRLQPATAAGAPQ